MSAWCVDARARDMLIARNGENVLELVRIRVCIKTLDPSECPPQLHFFYDISLSRLATKTPLISP